jgi:predicted GTPase
MLAVTQEGPVPTILAVNKCDIADPLASDETAHLIGLYSPYFAAVFCASALTGSQVTALFTQAARMAGADDHFPPQPVLASDLEKKAKCC